MFDRGLCSVWSLKSIQWIIMEYGVCDLLLFFILYFNSCSLNKLWEELGISYDGEGDLLAQ